LGIRLENIEVLPNGVDLSHFRPPQTEARQRTRSTLHLAETAFVIGVVGTLTPVKGHRVLLSAVARVARSVPGVQLVVVGDGPLRAELGDCARANGIGNRVHYVGQREDIPALLSALDAYVCSSESEGMSNALLEAMAAGLPVVATDVGDNAAILRHNVEGLIVPPRRIDDFVAALTKLALTPGLCHRFAAAARVRAEDYDLSRTVRAYERWYEGLARTPRRSCPPGQWSEAPCEGA
jgi:glycosyltransferase involved in cell wall biosynthesis